MPHRHPKGPTPPVAPDVRVALDRLIYAGANPNDVWRGYNRTRKAAKVAAHVAANPAWTPEILAALYRQDHLADQLCIAAGVRPGLSPGTLASVIALVWGGSASPEPDEEEERTPCLGCGSQDDDVMPRPIDSRAVAPLCVRCSDSTEVLDALSVDA